MRSFIVLIAIVACANARFINTLPNIRPNVPIAPLPLFPGVPEQERPQVLPPVPEQERPQVLPPVPEQERPQVLPPTQQTPKLVCIPVNIKFLKFPSLNRPSKPIFNLPSINLPVQTLPHFGNPSLNLPVQTLPLLEQHEGIQQIPEWEQEGIQTLPNFSGEKPEVEVPEVEAPEVGEPEEEAQMEIPQLICVPESYFTVGRFPVLPTPEGEASEEAEHPQTLPNFDSNEIGGGQTFPNFKPDEEIGAPIQTFPDFE